MENCRQGGERVVGFRPELYENWYQTSENVPSKQINCNNYDQSIMVDIKSVPSSVFDLSLQNLRQVIFITYMH